MTKKLSEEEVYDGLTEAIPFLLASLDGGVSGFELSSVALQRTSDGDFRCILRGVRTGTGSDGVGVVSFTNEGSPTGCLLRAEGAFAEDSLRWTVDRFAKNDSKDSAAKDERRKLSLQSGFKF